ncbi:hypothetical protein [Lichenicoccus sp.]|uniref:hypothetical protein n=1 Tax=Lichenicoccus sp. TaxID=2781899 RepID=UPI003D0B60FA
MSIRLLQMRNQDGRRFVAFTRNRGPAWRLDGFDTVLGLVLRTIEDRVGLTSAVAEHDSGEPVDLEAMFAQGRILAPIDHPDPAHLLVSWAAPDEQAAEIDDDEAEPAPWSAPPGWFFIASGFGVRGPGAALPRHPAEVPSLTAELAVVYVNGADGNPYRVGFALAGRGASGGTSPGQVALGGELLTGALPDESTPFTQADHHFRHEQFRRPGDVHVRLFGGLRAARALPAPEGAVVEVAATPFRYPLRCRLDAVPSAQVTIEVL